MRPKRGYPEASTGPMPTTTFEEKLTAAEDNVRAMVAQFDPRVLALTAVRLADLGYVNSPPTAAARAMTVMGVPPVLRALAAGPFAAPGWPLLVSDGALEREVLAVLSLAWRVAYVRRCFELARTGLGRVQDNDTKVEISYSNVGFDLESLDVMDETRLVGDLVEPQEASERAALDAMQPQVQDLTTRLVGPWMNHFIRYDAHPLLDEYFMRRAMLHCRYAQRMQDTFDGDTEFDGVPFYVYRAVAAVLVSLSLKHLAFVDSLLARDASLRPTNVLTIVDEPHKLVDATIDLLDSEARRSEVRKAFDAFTWHPGRDRELIAAGEDLPPLIQIGDGFVIRSIAGALRAPFYFLLKRLRLRTKDWSRAVQRREALMKREFDQLFPRARYRHGRGLAKLHDSGRVVTDIDAAVFDPVSATLGLFQLKWQDPFGVSATERRSRATNLVTRANAWIDCVLSWLATHDMAALQKVLHLPRENVRSVRLFVIARTHSNFSGSHPYNLRAAWGNWWQLARILLAHGMRLDPLAAAFDCLNEEFAARRNRIVEPHDSEFDIGSTRVRVIVSPGRP